MNGIDLQSGRTDQGRASHLSFLPPAPQGDAGAANGTVQLDLRRALEILRSRIRLIALVTLGTLAIAAAVTFSATPTYEAWALMRLQDLRTPLMRGVLEASQARGGATTDPVLSEIQVLTSRSLASQIVEHPEAAPLRVRALEFPREHLRVVAAALPDSAGPFRLGFGPQTFVLRGASGEREVPYGAPVDFEGVRFSIVSAPEEREGWLTVISQADAADSLLRHLSVVPRPRTDLIDVGFSDEDPVMAARLVNVAIQVFRNASIDRAQEQARRRRVFMEEQLRQNDSILDAAQRALSGFRGRNRSYSAAQAFASGSQALVGLDLQRADLEEERQTHRMLLASLTARDSGASQRLRTAIVSPSVAANPVIAQLNAQLLRHQATYDSLTSGEWRSAAGNPDVRRVQELVQSTRTQLEGAVRGYVNSLDARIEVLDGLKAAQVATFQNLPAAEVEEARLATRLEALRKVGDQLREEYQKTRIEEAVEAGDLQIIDAAVVPTRPSGIDPFYKMGLGLVLGLMLGGGAAFMRETLSTSIRRREEIEEVLQLPWLAVIPRIRNEPAGAGRHLADGLNGARSRRPRLRALFGRTEDAVLMGERALAADAFRVLQVNMRFASGEGVPRVIAVTSPTAHDGKTTTAINLAAALAEQGTRVLLVDCDLRRPRLHRLSRGPSDPGLVEVLLGRSTPGEVIRPLRGGVSLLTAGTVPPNPPALLGGARMRDTLAMLTAEYDVLVLDCAPALLGADAALVGTLSDGMIFVVRAGQTDRELAQNALEQLRRVGARVLGAVLNDPESVMPQYSYEANATYRDYYNDRPSYVSLSTKADVLENRAT